MSKSTPGPWIIEEEDGLYIVQDAAREMDPIYVDQQNDEREANARLIAAAPDLLAAAIEARLALSELLTTKDPVVYAYALKALDAAIAKATGSAA